MENTLILDKVYQSPEMTKNVDIEDAFNLAQDSTPLKDAESTTKANILEVVGLKLGRQLFKVDGEVEPTETDVANIYVKTELGYTCYVTSAPRVIEGLKGWCAMMGTPESWTKPSYMLVMGRGKRVMLYINMATTKEKILDRFKVESAKK